MLGTLLRKHGWHRKPVTHAALLWTLVAFAALMLLAFALYGTKLAEIKGGIVEARPAKTQVQKSLPSAFGTVTSFDGTVIEIESKQSFDRVIIDEITDISLVGGGTFDIARLAPGMTVMATGHADGETLLADALVILTEEDLDTATE